MATVRQAATAEDSLASSAPAPTPFFAGHADLSLCLAHVASAKASLLQLEDLQDDGVDASLQRILSAASELQAAFEFIDTLEHSVNAAGDLVEATERRLNVLERGEALPESIAQLPPPMFAATQFARQLRRREKAPPLDLPELVVLPPSQAGTSGGASDPAALPFASASAPTSVAEASEWASKFFGRAEVAARGSMTGAWTVLRRGLEEFQEKTAPG